jgi:thiamine-monophosphate kinase
MKVKDIGEFGLIDLISKKTKYKDILVGIGDDAAVIKTKGLQILTTDCLVESDHFKKEWFTPFQIGMKSIEINVSDVAAMGGVPKYVLVSLCIPKDLDVDFIEEMYKGMRKSCNKYDIEIIGGNMTHSNQIIISITLTGKVEKNNLKLRNGAKPDDFILVSGPLGNGRAGLRLFQKNLKGHNKVRLGYLEPKSKLTYGIKIAPFVNSMIDISDGLAPEIRHICRASACGAIIYKDKIPIKEDVREFAKTINEDPYDYALYGGEDFELLYTVSKENLDKVEGFLVGEITKKKDVNLFFKGKEKTIIEKGYNHFSKHRLW